MEKRKKFSTINNLIGNNILKIRNSKAQTQDEFADELRKVLKNKFSIKASYDNKTISNWEQGKSTPKLEVLIAICKEYNLSLDDLLKNDIDDVVSHSSFSASDETILNEFLDNPQVCIKENNKYISSYNPKSYKYGQLSYLADNLVEYRSSLSKNFSFCKPIKDVQVIVGIMDVNDGKRELHYLGNGENDIVSIENVPSNYTLSFVSNGNVIDTIMYNERINNNMKRIIRLGNGKQYILDEEISHYNDSDYKFSKDNLPSDLDFYELTEEDSWTHYACLKGHYIIDDDNLFDFESSNVYYYKKAGIFEIVLFGQIKVTDAQLVKILADDYKHRLIQCLAKISDDSICEQYKKEIDNYESKQ